MACQGWQTLPIILCLYQCSNCSTIALTFLNICALMVREIKFRFGVDVKRLLLALSEWISFGREFLLVKGGHY